MAQTSRAALGLALGAGRLRPVLSSALGVLTLHAGSGCERAQSADPGAPSASVVAIGESGSTMAGPSTLTGMTAAPAQSNSSGISSSSNSSAEPFPPSNSTSATTTSQSPETSAETSAEAGAGAAGGTTDEVPSSQMGGTAGLGGSGNAVEPVASEVDSDASEPTPTDSAPVPDAGADGDRCDIGVYDGTPPKVIDLQGDTFAHDPTLLQAGDVFLRYWTGDYVPVAISNDLQTWSNTDPVYPRTYPQWVNDWKADHPGNTFNFPWAPDVSFFGGRYHLYASFSAFFGRNASCITHLTTSTPDAGDWVDEGPVICSESDSDFNAIDPDVALDVDGNPWLAFGSFWDGIQLLPLTADGGRSGDEMLNIAWAKEIEAPVLFRRCGYYYLFVSWGLCCPGENRNVDDLTYRVVVGRATEIRGPYLDRDGVPMLEGGGTPIVAGDGDQFAAAGHNDVLVVGDTIYNTYHAYRLPNGNATLRIAEMPFDDEGWPVPAGP